MDQYLQFFLDQKKKGTLASDKARKASPSTLEHGGELGRNFMAILWFSLPRVCDGFFFQDLDLFR